MRARNRAFFPALLLAGIGLVPLQVLASAELAAKAGCSGCHAQDRKLFGPSYAEIAARYKADPDAPAVLADRMRKGSKGVWGPAPMQPFPPAKLSDADLTALIAWILTQ